MPISVPELRYRHRPLMIMAAAMAGLVVVAGIGFVVDDRRLLSESIWAKPFKFGVSFVLYGATLAWMLPQLRKARRTMWTVGTVFAVTGIVDVGFIAVQAGCGTFSHFNTATWTAAGATLALTALLTAVIVAAARRRPPEVGRRRAATRPPAGRGVA
ncbi:MAG TPA: hypothetical protein VD903_21260 [Pseudonocardia sp.]|nr:hypothetical protein [Pseudonocardia sp.]